MHRGQVDQVRRPIRVASGARSKRIPIQAKRDIKGVVRVVDLVVDEFRQRQV